MNEIEPFGFEEAHQAADFIGEQADKKNLANPGISVTLGSGLSSFAERYTREENRVSIPYSEIPHFPIPKKTVAGHAGKLMIAPVNEDPKETMAIWAGRVHFYQQIFRRCEGIFRTIVDPEVKKAAVVFYIAIDRALGVDDILTSNAVGSLWPTVYEKGDIVRISDHVLDPDDDFGVPEDERWFTDKKQTDPNYNYRLQDYFYSQGNLYSKEIYDLARGVADGMNLHLQEGVLNWRKGRGYESTAYCLRLHQNGIDLVGMSTAPEAQKAKTVGYSNKHGERRFAGFSVVSNIAQLEPSQQLQHGEVAEASAESEAKFNPFMIGLIREVARERAFRTVQI